MDTMLKVSNYKCFGSEPQGFERLTPITVIVGRNNAGKSALLELVRFSIELGTPNVLGFLGKSPIEIHYSGRLAEDALRGIFPQTTSGGPVPGNHWEFGCHWKGAPVTCAINVSLKVRATQFTPAHALSEPYQSVYADRVAHSVGRPYDGYTFAVLAANRNIVPERADPSEILDTTGANATNGFRLTMTQRGRNRDLVTKVILQALNEIFWPDGIFEEIQIIDDPVIGWEIYLREQGKEAVQLSQCGCGLRTILLVLAILHLGPSATAASAGRVIHAFEELENNLHPAVLRRLLTYIEKYSKEKSCPLFLTTHSSVTIDFFARSPDAQIVHVFKEAGQSRVRTVTTYVDHKNILDDLDVRASELLQANGIIWVEGPSDRTYLNKWIEIESQGEMKEGVHYQIVFYGGRLLSHLSAIPLEKALINVLSVNRNAALVIDSDSRSEDDAINSTKKRMKREVESIGGFCWVTKGREIENYVSLDTIKRAFSFDGMIPEQEKMAGFFETINRVDPDRGEYWKNHKSLLAETLVRHMDSRDVFGELDLKTQIASLLVKIRGWNQY